VVTPLLLLAGGGLFHMLAHLGVFPAMMRDAALVLGVWAVGQSKNFDAVLASLDHVNHLSDLGVTLTPLLHLAPVSFPALAAAALVWIVLRRISFRGEGGDLIARLHARTPNQLDPEEHQLTNIVEEMALAAGLPAPALLLIDSPVINAAAVGVSHGQASLLVTRGVLDQLDRAETSGVVAHLVASIGAGDIRLTHSILAVFQTFGFFVTFLDLPFRWSAWQALGGLCLIVTGLRRSPEAVAGTLDTLELGIDSKTMPDVERVWSVIPWPRVRMVLLAPLMPLMLISLILRLVLFLWTALFLGPPLALIWRNRRYAADAMAVQLTRDPDALAKALSSIGDSGIPEGGEGREYCFINGPPSSSRGGSTDRRNMTMSLHPAIGRRLQRLHALGATAGGVVAVRFIRFDMIAQSPGKALLAGFLLLLLVPLGTALILAIGYVTAIAMTLGLAAGLTIAAALLG
jgi:Zn-dependent protease with chaperone function